MEASFCGIYHKRLFAFFPSGKVLAFFTLMFFLLTAATNSANAAVEVIPAGSRIINMGKLPQTEANALKPYGLVYALLKANVPVNWVINPSKSKDGVDFTHNGVTYRGGAFIVTGNYVTSSVNAIFAGWLAKGVDVDTSVSNFSVDVAKTLKAAPVWVLDAGSGNFAESYLRAADIPSSAWATKQPSQLTSCDDIFILPHENPSFDKHKNLYYWNKNFKGALWAGCNSVSTLENLSGPDINTPATTITMNFLMKDGNTPTGNALDFNSHTDGSPPYVTQYPAHPIMQFMGKTDRGHQDGPEKIYLPSKTGGWRTSTYVGVYDPSHNDVPSKSKGPAAAIVFGRAFGDETRGYVLYEAGHKLDNNGGGEDNIAAQRVFLNFSFFAVIDKSFTVGITGLPAIMNSTETYTNIVANTSTPLFGVGFKYQWYSSCGGTFSNPTSATTSFTAPVVSVPENCVITCKVTDDCGRVSFDSKSFTVVPGPRAPVCTPDVAAVPSCGGKTVTLNILDNDANPDGGPLTITLLSNGTKGTFVHNGNGNITYTPTVDYNGTDQLTYQVCTAIGQCCTSTLTVNATLLDANLCTSKEYWGVAAITSASSLATISGAAPVNATNSYGDPDGNISNAATYTDFNTTAAATYVYTLSSAVTAAGNLKLYVDAAASKAVTISQSADNVTFTNSQVITVNTTDDFLESAAKTYALSTGSQYIKIDFTAAAGTVQVDAITFENFTCLPAVPVAGTDQVTTPEDIPLAIDVAANDRDPRNQLMIVSGIVVQPMHGRVSVNPDNTINYLNNKDDIGTGVDSFVYRICNSSGLCATATVRISITEDACPAGQYKSFNGAPVIVSLNPVADAYISQSSPAINYGTSNNLSIKGKSDGSLKRSLLNFDLTGIPTTAIVDSAYVGIYQIDGANNENISAIRNTKAWTEAGVNWNTTNGATAWSNIGGDFGNTVWATANTGATNAVYKYLNVKNLVQAWVKGTYMNYGMFLTRDAEGANGSYREMTFTANNAASDKPVIWIRYNTLAASCSAIPAYGALAVPDTLTTNATTPVTIDVKANDFDYNASGLTVSLTRLVSRRGGTLSMSADQVVYTPPTSPYFNGVDTFTYVITSSGLLDSANVYITITNAPPLANHDFFTIQTNTSTTPSSLSTAVTTNDFDPEAAALTSPVLVQTPKNGVATFSPLLQYTPNQNFIGSDTLIYRLSETSGSGCSLFTDTALVIINVENRAPVAVDDAVSINGCEIRTIKILDNDHDPENGILTVSVVANPGVGTVTIINNGSEIQYNPPPAVTGVTTSFTYQVCDTNLLCSNIATVSITIRPTAAINNPPVANRDTFKTNMNLPAYHLSAVLHADVLTNDKDPEEIPLSVPVTIITPPTKGIATAMSGGLVEYIPNDNYFGLDSFYYRVADNIPTDPTCTPYQQEYGYAWAYIIVQDRPLAFRDYITVNKNASGIVNVTTNDIFAMDGPAMGTIAVVTPPTRGNITVLAGANPDQSDDQIRFIPNVNFVGRDSMMYQICDKTADCDTAIVYILVKPDKDSDGVPDDTDLDDDNDGIVDAIEVCGNGATSFACFAGGLDPAGDDDKDGLENWRDADYGTLNARGTIAILDSDSDGIPNFLDLDADNDGIPDVIESGGADSNGDGIIDNFCDPDEDGLSQNLDLTNTGAAGSGAGLGFTDFDADNVPNSADLDSDNDGIPDLVEAKGGDSDNDGRVDEMDDTDKDGIANKVDGDVNGDNIVEDISAVLLNTSIDSTYVNCSVPGNGRPAFCVNKGNTDHCGQPDFLDLDSDGDGIVDATESGISVATIINGKVSGCTLEHGWCATIDVLPSLDLADTDLDGLPDVIDIDSDNDGITDNVEGQPTGSYVVPADADTDKDGLADVYDVLNGNGGNGITPYDHDYDGIPDYIDVDADNDGAPDRNEGDLANKTLDQVIVDISGDSDTDGLMDYFDCNNFNEENPDSVFVNVSMGNMGPAGNFNGPMPAGSKVGLVKSEPTSTDRDWRTVTILPLRIISFAGMLENRAANLTWKVENEKDIEEYVVERSNDGVHFTAISSVTANNLGKGTYIHADNLADYTFLQVYYRIRQISKSKEQALTKVVSFKLGNVSEIKITLYPNPVGNRLTLNIPSTKKQITTINIADASGKTVLQRTISLEKGENVLQLQQVSQLSKGMYLIKIKTVDTDFIDKLIKQ
jgi:hypothetical protein